MKELNKITVKIFEKFFNRSPKVDEDERKQKYFLTRAKINAENCLKNKVKYMTLFEAIRRKIRVGDVKLIHHEIHTITIKRKINSL